MLKWYNISANPYTHLIRNAKHAKTPRQFTILSTVPCNLWSNITNIPPMKLVFLQPFSFNKYFQAQLQCIYPILSMSLQSKRLLMDKIACAANKMRWCARVCIFARLLPSIRTSVTAANHIGLTCTQRSAGHTLAPRKPLSCSLWKWNTIQSVLSLFIPKCLLFPVL